MQTKNSSDLEETIQKATPLFEHGFAINERLKANIKKNSIPEKNVRKGERLFVQYVDNAYLDYDANRIKGTNFIATSGPDIDEVASFVKHVIFNEQLQATEIIALGVYLATTTNAGFFDFYDYCNCSGINGAMDYTENAKELEYKVNIVAKRKDLNELQLCELGDKVSIGTIIQSDLTITFSDRYKEKNNKQTEVSMTLLPLDDKWFFNLIKKDYNTRIIQSLEQQKEVLWQLFYKSLTELIIVHCSSGVGRTGHLILTFEILKNYHEIFNKPSTDDVSKAIMDIVNRIRENRPSLILTPLQFEYAIRNAVVLYHFALEKGYIQEGMPVYDSALAQKPNKAIELKQNTAYHSNSSNVGLFSRKKDHTTTEVPKTNNTQGIGADFVNGANLIQSSLAITNQLFM